MRQEKPFFRVAPSKTKGKKPFPSSHWQLGLESIIAVALGKGQYSSLGENISWEIHLAEVRGKKENPPISCFRMLQFVNAKVMTKVMITIL